MQSIERPDLTSAWPRSAESLRFGLRPRRPPRLLRRRAPSRGRLVRGGNAVPVRRHGHVQLPAREQPRTVLRAWSGHQEQRRARLPRLSDHRARRHLRAIRHHTERETRRGSLGRNGERMPGQPVPPRHPAAGGEQQPDRRQHGHRQRRSAHARRLRDRRLRRIAQQRAREQSRARQCRRGHPHRHGELQESVRGKYQRRQLPGKSLPAARQRQCIRSEHPGTGRGE